jgi:hypothetical protein
LKIYAQEPDPVLSRNVAANQEMTFDGRKIDDDHHSLISINTSKQMGAASGTWSAVVKSAKPFSQKIDLSDSISDDAWVDIHFSRHNRRYFTMRGMVDTIRRNKAVSGTGATTTTYTLSGRDFGKVWELTPLWFNKFAAKGAPENIEGSASMRVFSSLGLLGGATVADIVEVYLIGFLDKLGDLGRSNWVYPIGMPGIGPDRSFTTNLGFDSSGFTNDPPRIAVAPSFLDPNGANAWAMAQEWSDPAFVELFADLTDGDFNVASDQLENSSAYPCYFVRDRPFPTLALGLDSPWFELPTIQLPREDIVNEDLGRGGMERFNAFFVSPQILQDFMPNNVVEITSPLWDATDMLEHGFRRYDINSRYQLDLNDPLVSEEEPLLKLTTDQRDKVRDWYALNPYFYSGTIECSRGVLEARIGKRLFVPGRDSKKDLTAYIEGVSHSWQFGRGIRSSLGITRGWYGTDQDYLDALQQIAKRYNNRTAVADVFGRSAALG